MTADREADAYYRQRLYALDLRPVRIAKLLRWVRAERFYRRTIEPEMRGLIEDMRQGIWRRYL